MTARPASARYIVRRLFSYFVYPDPTDADLQPFVDAYTKANYSIRAAVESILRSDVFYSPKAYRALVKSPVEYTIGAIKAVNGQAQLTQLVAGQPRLGGLTGAMGQTIYEPPDVAGWPGNTSWLNASTMFARLNFSTWSPAARRISATATTQRRRPCRAAWVLRSRPSITSCPWCWTTTSRRTFVSSFRLRRRR